MRALTIITILILLLLTAGQIFGGTITVTGSSDVLQLAQTLVGNGITMTGATLAP